MTLDEYKNKTLVGYLIYAKERDDAQSVCLKEICVAKAYRKRCVATHFLRRVCVDYFKKFNFKRITFQMSSFNSEMVDICKKKSGLVKRAYCWKEYKFLPGVNDERTMCSIDIDAFLK